MSQVKKNIRKSFANASSSYDCVAKLQAKVGKTLLEQLDKVSHADSVLDLGCGTGFLLQSWLAGGKPVPRQMLALDIALPMLTSARNKLNNADITYICADAETLPLAEHSMDCVMSNFALQWCEDLEAAVAEVKRVLKPGGNFAFTLFGEQTLCELKQAWRAVDDVQHVNTFVNPQRLTKLLETSGFTVRQLTDENYVSVYESVWDLMAELKQLGAQTVMAGRRRQLTVKTKMELMIQAYQRQDENGLVPATFEVISVLAEVL